MYVAIVTWGEQVLLGEMHECASMSVADRYHPACAFPGLARPRLPSTCKVSDDAWSYCCHGCQDNGFTPFFDLLALLVVLGARDRHLVPFVPVVSGRRFPSFDGVARNDKYGYRHRNLA
jgi:hypothetical protein